MTSGFEAIDREGKLKHQLLMPTILMEAEIDEDVILSYQWLGERDVQVSPREHGLWVTTPGHRWWVDGVRSDPRQRANARLPRQPVLVRKIPANRPDNKKRALDMFCGRKSAAKVLEEWGYEVVTLDNDPARDPTICSDVLS